MPDLSVAQEILLAAADLFATGRREFSEWDLTVRVWEMNKQRFGCRGYEDSYPDHKRVMMELMGKGKLVRERGWIEKTRKNHYRITSLGLAEAARLRESGRPSHRRAANLYDALERYAFHSVFKAHLQSEGEPKTWLGAAAFLGLQRNDFEELERRLADVRHAIEGSLEWMRETGMGELRRGDAGKAMSREVVVGLAEFLSVLEERFAAQLEAIRSRR